MPNIDVSIAAGLFLLLAVVVDYGCRNMTFEAEGDNGTSRIFTFQESLSDSDGNEPSIAELVAQRVLQERVLVAVIMIGYGTSVILGAYYMISYIL